MQENTTNNKRKKNQSRATNWELIQVLKLAQEDIKIIIISNTDVQNIKWVLEDIKVTQVRVLEIKNTMFDMKDIMDGIDVILNIAEEKISELEDIIITTTPHETLRERRILKH